MLCFFRLKKVRSNVYLPWQLAAIFFRWRISTCFFLKEHKVPNSQKFKHTEDITRLWKLNYHFLSTNFVGLNCLLLTIKKLRFFKKRISPKDLEHWTHSLNFTVLTKMMSCTLSTSWTVADNQLYKNVIKVTFWFSCALKVGQWSYTYIL